MMMLQTGEMDDLDHYDADHSDDDQHCLMMIANHDDAHY